MKEGVLWDPRTRDFEEWNNFYDEDKCEFVVSYYSIFQCYTLYNITRLTKMEIRAEWWYTYSDKDIARLTEKGLGVKPSYFNGCSPQVKK